MKQFLWCLTLAVLAVLTMLTQLDRASRYQSELAELVPQNFRYFAQLHITDAALEREDANAALAEARALVARRPVPAEHLRMLAQAQILSGESAAGTSALQLAGQRGWRDPQTQFAMLGLANARGNHTEAVRRYFALWVQPDNRAALKPWSKTAFASPEAQNEAARLLNAKSRWQRGFLQSGMRDLPPEHAATILAALKPACGDARC